MVFEMILFLITFAFEAFGPLYELSDSQTLLLAWETECESEGQNLTINAA